MFLDIQEKFYAIIKILYSFRKDYILCRQKNNIRNAHNTNTL